MTSLLETCPHVVIEIIVSLLILKDICNLRQCSQYLATKITQGQFKSHFRSKHVDITEGALQAFIEQTQRGRLGCLVQDLVLVGVVNNTQALEALILEEHNEEVGLATAQHDLAILKQREIDNRRFHESGSDVDMLTKAFGNIVSNSSSGKLRSLSLQVVVYRDNAQQRLPPLAGGSWRFIWQSAVDTFHTAMRSLAPSKLPIHKLVIFNDRQLQRCSLPCNELGRIDFQHKGLAVSLACLKSLSVSFSNRVIFFSKHDADRSYDPAEVVVDSEVEPDLSTAKAQAAETENFTGLANLLQLSNHLENLHLHQYILDAGLLPPADRHHEKVLQHLAEMPPPLPQLHHLDLRGLYVREQDLLALLQRTRVRNLSMHDVVLSSGTFRSVFDHCCAGEMLAIEFHCLYESGGRSVRFDEPEVALSASGVSADAGAGAGGSDSLKREGENLLKRRITYRAAQEFLQGSPAVMELRRQKWREYGPPSKGVA